MTELSSFDSSGIQVAWDATSIKSWQTCPRYYYYKHVGGWQPKRPSVHLWFGGLYASALESYHKHRADGMDYEDAVDAILDETLQASWDKEEGCPIDYDDPNKNRHTLIRTIIWYLEEFKNDSMATHILPGGKPGIELSFAMPVDNDIIFCGHMDRIVEYSGELLGQDQKTTKSALSSMYFSQFDLDDQMSMYTFVTNFSYNIPVKGMAIDAAQILVGSSRFGRVVTQRTEEQLNEWYDNTIYTITQAQNMIEADKFPMNLTACSKYGGCEFRGVCSKSQSVRKNFLVGDFKQEPRWDPIQRR